MTQLSLANIINISVSSAPTGIGAYNTSNLAIFSIEQPTVAFAGGFKIYLTASEVVADFAADSLVGKMANAVFSQSPNILQGGGYLVVIPLLLGTEKIDAAILRTKGLVQYFGILGSEVIADVDAMTAASAVQAIQKIMFLARNLAADVDASGFVQDISDAKLSHTRPILYLTDAGTDNASVIAIAAYASRGLSVDFSGNNTTTTMHMKDLIGIASDGNITQTILTKCELVGADCYANFQGVAKVFSTGANKFFDQIYNQLWFVGDLEVRGFNYLATTSTKIPQTEEGVSGLKGAYRGSCEQALVNQYVAAGSWTSPDTFGNLADFKRNIEEKGYYIFSSPVNLQSAADRAARKAPLIQIAIKEAGSVHSSSVIVNINF